MSDSQNLKPHLLTAEAAKLLGVRPATIRRWADKNKIQFIRHPMNGYRLFSRSDMQKLVEMLK